MTRLASEADEIFWAYRIVHNAETGDGQPVTSIALAMAESSIARWCTEHGIDSPPATFALLVERYPHLAEQRRVA